MPRRTVLLALVALVFACAAPGVASGDGDRLPRELTTSSCNVVKVDGQGYVLFRRGVACTWAKRWVRRLAASQGRNKPAGYTCSSGSKFRGGGYCERGRRHFGWHGGE